MTKNNKTRTLARAACALGLGLALTAAAAPVAAHAEYLGYVDVPSDHWAAQSKVIDYATGRGIFTGYDSEHFGPDDPVNRGQMAVVMYRVCAPEEQINLGQKVLSNNNRPFNNGYGKVAGRFYDFAMNWAYYMGLIKGNGTYVFPKQNMYGDIPGTDYVDPEPWETFKYQNSRSEPNVRPDDPVTREELAVMLQRMAEHRGTYDATDADYAALDAFPDAGSVSDWARDAVAWAVGEDIIGGNGVIDPQGTATRAEAAKMFEIAIEGEGFTIEGRDKVWVEGSLYTTLPYWTCTSCGASSTYGKNEMTHKASCPIHTGGVVWIAESQSEEKMYPLSEVTGGQKEFLKNRLDYYGMLTGWYEWV